MTVNLLPTGSRKFRENTADSVLFHMMEHTADRPSTVTVTRTLPTPRKGNPGTQKTTINCRTTSILDVGLATERKVPVIVKIETSVPVGADYNDFIRALNNISGAVLVNFNTLTSEQRDLFITGLLPEAPVATSGV